MSKRNNVKIVVPILAVFSFIAVLLIVASGTPNGWTQADEAQFRVSVCQQAQSGGTLSEHTCSCALSASESLWTPVEFFRISNSVIDLQKAHDVIERCHGGQGTQ